MNEEDFCKIMVWVCILINAITIIRLGTKVSIIMHFLNL